MEVWSNDGTETTGWNNAIGLSRNVGQMVLGINMEYFTGVVLVDRAVIVIVLITNVLSK